MGRNDPIVAEVARMARKKRRPRGHHHAELIGLALIGIGLFLATLLYLGWEGGVVGTTVDRWSRELIGVAAYGAPVVLTALGALMVARSALVDVRPFRTGLALT